MDSELKLRAKEIRKIVFDLSGVDTVVNTAGRVFDLAVEYCKRYKRRGIKPELWIPKNVYRDLQRVEPEELPAHPKRSTSVRGVTILMRPSVTESVEVHPIPRARTAVTLSCLGKVRAVAGLRVTVSLFTDEGEVVGEFSRSQFPDARLRVGQVFQYETDVTSPGKTEVTISLPAERDLDPDEIIDLWKEIDRQLPRDEY